MNSDDFGGSASMSRTGASDEYHGTMFAKPTLEQFSLSQYLGEYQGRVKIRRALYLGERCPELSIESYHIALDEIKSSTTDINLYESVFKSLEQLGGAAASDAGWVGSARKTNNSVYDLLSAELNKAKQQHIKKDGLRAQEGLAQHKVRLGNLNEALRTLQDARDYCSSIDDQVNLALTSAWISQMMGKWLQVNSYVQRVVSTLSTLPPKMTAEIKVLQIQADFGEGRWSAVVNNVRGLVYDEIMSAGIFERGLLTPQDIAVYGTLAGLASLQRDDLKRQIIDNAEFGKFLDYIPECSRLLRCFYSSAYSDALSKLDGILSLGVLDPVVAPHATTVRSQIVENVVVLYTQPFVSTSLSAMAKALRFGSTSQLEAMLTRLIERNLILGRIDAVSGYLLKYTLDPRDQTLETIERMYTSFSDQADVMLARIHYLEEETVSNKPRFEGRR
ncbi:cop9 signalosome complex subunit [Coemansia sp. S2]|nr:cop9 signalosome complex subunit [Coemansia sp. S2]